MRAATAWRTVVVLALVVGCAPPQRANAPAADESGPGRDVVCQRFITDMGKAGSIRRTQTNGRVTSPPEAAQHLDAVETFREFGRWARDAEDPTHAELAARIEDEATRVMEQLSPDDSDGKAQRLTKPLYGATGELYYDCQRELYRELLRTGGVEMDGACAEPGAPKLEGPNVMVYGSNEMFMDPECVLVQGDVVGGGCGYSNEGDPAPAGGGPHGSVQVAEDPDTCRALFERGRVKPQD